jgi:hypothetical protein
LDADTGSKFSAEHQRTVLVGSPGETFVIEAKTLDESVKWFTFNAPDIR